MRLKKISALSLAAAMSVCTVPAFGAAETENVNVPKYIFLFIGDGMSYPQVQTTNYYLNAIAGDTPTRVLANGRGFLRHGRTPQRTITSPLHPVTGLPLSRLFCGCLF